MCLYPTKKETAKVLTRIKRNKSKSIVVYKQLSQHYNGEFVTPWYKTKVALDKDGFFHSNRETTKIKPNETTRYKDKCFAHVHIGIHVYLNPWERQISLCFPCRGYLKDFVAAGGGEAVFTKVKFSKKILASLQKVKA